MRRRLATTIILLFVAFAVEMRAQGLPPGKWWKRPEVVRHLGLTVEQQDHLDQIFRSRAERLIDLKAEIEKGNIALRGELDRAKLDRSAIRAAAARVSEARAGLFEEELMLLADMRDVLNAEQWTRFRVAIDNDRLDRGRGRRVPRPGAERTPH